MAFESAKRLYGKAIKAINTEGVVGLVKKTAVFISSRLFVYQRFNIYENDFNGPEYESLIPNPVLVILKTTSDLDEVLKQGFDLSYFDVDRVRLFLSEGSLGFCVFVEKEIAHMTWVALNDESKKLIDPVPYKVDYMKGEVCSGGSETNPKYARKRIYLYAYSKIFKYLRENGKTRDLFSISKSNVSSNAALKKFGSKILFEGVYMRLINWVYWKEMRAGDAK